MDKKIHFIIHFNVKFLGVKKLTFFPKKIWGKFSPNEVILHSSDHERVLQSDKQKHFNLCKVV